MFLNPDDQRPFFGGTYFPKEARYGMPAFSELLQSVAKYYQDQRDEVRAQGQQLADIFTRLEPPPAAADLELNATPLVNVRQQLEQSFDRDYGGFGSAPKFPHPTTIERLLRHWRATASTAEPDIEALFMASLTLTRMADGGLFDHLGGGFYRYSVDRYWQIPHFEKMLYDNGPLLALYAQAFLATGENLFADTANATADWMLADMQSPQGGFYATRDADSEGEEGRYYVWTPEQAAALLAPEDYKIFAAQFGLDNPANFEGKWHLTVSERSRDDAIDRARKTLLAARDKRIAPQRDEKQLTSWNALAIRGLAIAGRSLDRPELIDAAVQAADFIQQTLFVDGRLLANFKDGEAKLAAYLDDHAFLLDALIELLQARWSEGHLEFALQLAELLLEHFEDSNGGGFFFTADDHEQLMHRSKSLADDALPSGNGVAALALQRLGLLKGETRYLDAAERTLRAAWKAMEEYPNGHVSLLTALDEFLQPPQIIKISGPATEVAAWQSAAAKLYAPRRLLFAQPGGGDITAQRCVGTQCDLAVHSWRDFVRMLKD
jgi:uncharacterized protein YyaL (SSP411 family)